nr:hypothetical protein [Deltaproteobacteria bacterium]
HLQALFQRTMGAPHAFEHRRAELGPVDDDAVVRSFLEDVAPDGVVSAYLARSRMTHRIGDTLFVHGGIPEAAWLHLPDGTRCPDLDTWTGELERWLVAQLGLFAEDPTGALADPPAWWPLIAYQMPQLPSRAHAASIIYGRTVFDGNNPALPAIDVRRDLLAADLPHLVVGHTPNGDMPSFVRDEAGFTLVVADTSYPRSAVCPVLWHDGYGLRARGRAALDDGRDLAAKTDLRHDPRVGRWVGGWLDKGELESGERLMFRFTGGTTFEQIAD